MLPDARDILTISQTSGSKVSRLSLMTDDGRGSLLEVIISDSLIISLISSTVDKSKSVRKFGLVL